MRVRTPQFLIPYVDRAIYNKEKLYHTFARQVSRWKFNPHKLNRVLINILHPGTGIGDYIHCTPLVTVLKETSPNVEISFLVSGKDDLAIFELFPFSVSIINIRPTQINHEYMSSFAKTVLRSKDFDLVIHSCLEDMWLAEIITQSGGFKNSISFYKKEILDSRSSITMALPPPKSNNSCFSYDDNLKRILDVNTEYQAILTIQKINKVYDVNGFIRQENKKCKVLGLHPGCNANRKDTRWSAENYMNLALLFRKKFNGRVLIFGGPSEEETVRMMVNKAEDNEIKAVIGQPLLKVAVLINKCDLFVSNDSGLASISMGMGVPSIGIFGPTDTSRHRTIFSKAILLGERLPCCPCINTDHYLHCPDGDFIYKTSSDSPMCLQLISVNEVFQQVSELLTNN